MSVKITWNNLGLTTLEENLRNLDTHVLTIGFQGESGLQLYPTGINVATVALFNEFGTKDIPERAFLRSAMKVEKKLIAQLMAKASRTVVLSLSSSSLSVTTSALSHAGKGIVWLVKRRINMSKSWAKPNASSTVTKKGFDYPLHESLVNSVKLVDSVTWAVRKGSSRGPILVQGK